MMVDFRILALADPYPSPWVPLARRRWVRRRIRVLYHAHLVGTDVHPAVQRVLDRRLRNPKYRASFELALAMRTPSNVTALPTAINNVTAMPTATNDHVGPWAS